MGVPRYHLTTNFSAKCQLTTMFLANCQLATNFSELLTFTLKRKIFYHNLNLLHFTELAN